MSREEARLTGSHDHTRGCTGCDVISLIIAQCTLIMVSSVNCPTLNRFSGYAGWVISLVLGGRCVHDGRRRRKGVQASLPNSKLLCQADSKKENKPFYILENVLVFCSTTVRQEPLLRPRSPMGPRLHPTVNPKESQDLLGDTSWQKCLRENYVGTESCKLLKTFMRLGKPSTMAKSPTLPATCTDTSAHLAQHTNVSLTNICSQLLYNVSSLSELPVLPYVTRSLINWLLVPFHELVTWVYYCPSFGQKDYEMLCDRCMNKTRVYSRMSPRAPVESSKPCTPPGVGLRCCVPDTVGRLGELQSESGSHCTKFWKWGALTTSGLICACAVLPAQFILFQAISFENIYLIWNCGATFALWR